MSDELKALRAKAEAFCASHLRECCVEIIEWQNTALLRDGKVRELAEMCGKYAGGYDGLKVAERMVQNQACEFVATPSPFAAPAGQQDTAFEEWCKRADVPRFDGRATGAAIGAVQWARAAWDAALRTQKALPPEGFTFAPFEPTEAMVHAAEDIPAPRMFGTVYRAMLAAAPTPSTTQFKGENDLIVWLDGLYACEENGAIHNRKWEPAQRAIAGIKQSSTAPTVEVDERAAFEAWGRNACGMINSSLEKSGDRYLIGRTADMWAAWQAGLASKPPAREAAERQSIDTQAFRNKLLRVLVAYDQGGDYDEARSDFIAHIDTWAGRSTDERERELCAKMGAMQAQIDQLTAERSAGDAVLAPLYSTRQDAERFRRAIALEDNAEALYAAVLSHAPDGNAIRRAFDSDAAPAPGNTAQPEKDG